MSSDVFGNINQCVYCLVCGFNFCVPKKYIVIFCPLSMFCPLLFLFSLLLLLCISETVDLSCLCIYNLTHFGKIKKTILVRKGKQARNIPCVVNTDPCSTRRQRSWSCTQNGHQLGSTTSKLTAGCRSHCFTQTVHTGCAHAVLKRSQLILGGLPAYEHWESALYPIFFVYSAWMIQVIVTKSSQNKGKINHITFLVFQTKTKQRSSSQSHDDTVFNFYSWKSWTQLDHSNWLSHFTNRMKRHKVAVAHVWCFGILGVPTQYRHAWINIYRTH